MPVLDPAPYRPRSDARRRGRLLREFAERAGDPEAGGSASRQRLTAYRQDALRCARELADAASSSSAPSASVPESILRDNYHGWFDRVKTGYYDLSPKGRRDLVYWSDALQDLGPRSEPG